MWIYFLVFTILAFIFILLLAKFSKNLDDVYFIVYFSNLWHAFLIYIKWKILPKKQLTFPFDIKKYISKNAPIKIQIKLFQSSKQFQQIISKHRGKQCGELSLGNFETPLVLLDLTNIFLLINLKDKFLTEDNPLCVKELFSVIPDPPPTFTNEDLDELYPKLDLTELKGLEYYSIDLSATVFRKYLVPSLVEINLHNATVENVDIPLFILQNCPLATKVYVNWQKDITSLSKLAAVKRKTKFAIFQLLQISDIICIQDVINFINNQMDADSFFVLLKSDDGTNYPENLQTITRAEINEILQKNVPKFSTIETCVSCKVIK